MDLYEYVSSRPLSLTDPLGLDGSNPYGFERNEDLTPNWVYASGHLNHSQHAFAVTLLEKYDGDEVQRAVYKDLKKFKDFNGGYNKGGRVFLDGDIARFEALGMFSMLSELINPVKVPVRLTYQEKEFTVSGQTLGQHMLVGMRKWGVDLKKAKSGECLTDGTFSAKQVIVVWTESWDRPNGWTNRLGMWAAGSESQLEIWEQYLRNIRQAIYNKYDKTWFIDKTWDRGWIGGSQYDKGDQRNPWQPKE